MSHAGALIAGALIETQTGCRSSTQTLGRDRDNLFVVSHVDQRSAALGALGAVLVGGTIGWILVFSGLGIWGLVIGLVATAIIVLAVGRRPRPHSRLAALAAFGFAFILLTWPPLWLVVGYIRYVITGDSLGS